MDHSVTLDAGGPVDYQSVVAVFTRALLKETGRIGGYDLLYPKVRDFMCDHVFTEPVDLNSPVVLRNLAEPEASKMLIDTFRSAINALTIRETSAFHVEGWIHLSDTRPFRTEPRDFPADKAFSLRSHRGGGERRGLELAFAAFLGS